MTMPPTGPPPPVPVPPGTPEPVTAHDVEEDPELHLGPVIDDPWSDDAQTDWPNNPGFD